MGLVEALALSISGRLLASLSAEEMRNAKLRF